MAGWYCSISGRQYGPVSREELQQWILQGRVGPNDLVWTEGMTAWSPVSAVSELSAGLPPSPPPGMVTPGAPQLKSKLAAGLLGILLGGFGVHNFYLGFHGKAIAQLLITVLTCGVGAIVSQVWGIVEGVMILTGSINADADGRPLRD